MLGWVLTVWLIYGQTPPEEFRYPDEASCVAHQSAWDTAAQGWLSRSQTYAGSEIRITSVSRCAPQIEHN